MSNIKLAVFDMAGTTVDEGNVVYKTLANVLNNSGFSITLEDVLIYGAGKEKRTAIADILRKFTTIENVDSLADDLFATFKIELERAYERLTVTTYPGMERLFQNLRKNKIQVVLNTGYDKKTATSLLNKLNWNIGDTIDALVTADDAKTGRPAPDMIYKAMEICNITNADEVLKAGDSAIDIEEGKNAKCGITVGVLSGAQTKLQLEAANPDYILKSLPELDKILFTS